MVVFSPGDELSCTLGGISVFMALMVMTYELRGHFLTIVFILTSSADFFFWVWVRLESTSFS
jgi:hypothetical protein